MLDRHSLSLLLVLLLLGGVSALMTWPKKTTGPVECKHPSVDDKRDPDLLRCDGRGENAGPRNWLVAKKLDINLATAAQLRRLPRVGSGLAHRVVDKRNELGEFSSVDELTRAKGFGPKTLANVRHLVEVSLAKGDERRRVGVDDDGPKARE